MTDNQPAGQAQNYSIVTFFEIDKSLQVLHTEPEMENNVSSQLLWGLALMKVMEEGLTQYEQDILWEPQPAFQRIRSKLKTEAELYEGDRLFHHIIEDMRITINKLQAISFLSKKQIIAFLHTFAMERKNTVQFSNFLNEELRIEETVQHHEAIFEEYEEAPQFDREFQEKFRQAMTAMLNTKDDAMVLSCFRRAYEYRKGFSWLAESRETPDVIGQNGLSCALRSALSGYIVRSPEEAERRIMSVVMEDRVEKEQQYVDTGWTTRLLEAISATIQEGFSLERFENHLVRAQVDITSDTLDTLRLHIAAALVSYYERRKMGLSADPF